MINYVQPKDAKYHKQINNEQLYVFPTKERPAADEFTVETYQIFQEELTPMLLNIFQKNTKVSHTSKLIV
jgi:hypothetical protein